MQDLQLPQKGFCQVIELKYKDDPVWLDRVWPLLFSLSIIYNYAAIYGIMFFLGSGETYIGT